MPSLKDTILNEVRGFLKAEGARYFESPDLEDVLSLQTEVGEFAVTTFLRVAPGPNVPAPNGRVIVAIDSLLPIRVPEGPVREQVSKSILAINFELVLGAFQLDTDDGEVRFHSGFLLKEWDQDLFLDYFIGIHFGTLEDKLPELGFPLGLVRGGAPDVPVKKPMIGEG